MLDGEDPFKKDNGGASVANTLDPTVDFDPDDDEVNGAGIAGASFSFAEGLSDELKAALNETLTNGLSFTVENTSIANDDTLASSDKITVNFDELLKLG